MIMDDQPWPDIPIEPPNGYKFPYPILLIILTWFLLGLAYVIGRWRKRPKNIYIIPRVFVLCSPRTVQFHYELILRVGLASYEFNPDKHDIDITVQGQQRNEVVPMTRINTRTLLDDPLITSLSIIVYRLVEMPSLGYLVLRHSGPFKAWIYAYDFTVIDLSTNKEQYFTLNQYIGSLNRNYQLEDNTSTVHYPIDDVPLPQWTTEDIYLVLYTVVNCIMLSITLMPVNCSYTYDILSIALVAINGGSVVFFLEWLLYYYLRWNQERREYFNIEESRYRPGENTIRVLVTIIASIIGICAIYFALSINEWKDSIVWMLATINTFILVIGFWNVARQFELGEAIVAFGLKIRGIEMESVGMKYSELISGMHTKSGSTDDGGSTLSVASKLARSIGPRSSVKSFGFDPITGHPSRRANSKLPFSQVSNTGATPNNQPGAQMLRTIYGQKPGHHPAVQHQIQTAPQKQLQTFLHQPEKSNSLKKKHEKEPSHSNSLKTAKHTAQKSGPKTQLKGLTQGLKAEVIAKHNGYRPQGTSGEPKELSGRDKSKTHKPIVKEDSKKDKSTAPPKV